MDLHCLRCHAALPAQANFCSECGAPQLTVDAPEEEPAADSAPGYALGDSGIAWPRAISAAAMLAVPAGLLSSLLSFSTLWVVAGGVWTTVLYRRRTSARLNPGLGSRIGCVFGVFAATIATLVDALNLLISRYGLHHGADIDSRLHDAMQVGIDRAMASNPDYARQIPWFFHFWLSPDGQAGLVLASAVISAASMLGFAALGGALGARYFGSDRWLGRRT
ncbi:MAG TPA: zinc ribbon domain-containing protein [Acidobacteriaceae bacterium]